MNVETTGLGSLVGRAWIFLCAERIQNERRIVVVSAIVGSR